MRMLSWSAPAARLWRVMTQDAAGARLPGQLLLRVLSGVFSRARDERLSAALPVLERGHIEAGPDVWLNDCAADDGVRTVARRRAGARIRNTFVVLRHRVTGAWVDQAGSSSVVG